MTLNELATALNLVAIGDLSHELTALAPIESAKSTDVSFVVSAKYIAALRNAEAGVVIVSKALIEHVSGNYIISDDPYASYAAASWILKPVVAPVPGVHNTALIDDTATVAPSASIGPGVVVGADTRIGDGAVLGAHSVIGAGVTIGTNTRLFPRVCVYDDVRIGQSCRVQSGAVIGSEGFGYAWKSDGWSQIQQTGGVELGDNVHIGANTTIDCGAIEPTVIEDGVILDNQIQIAHNVRIGKNTAIAGCVGIAGSTKIGAHCQIGGACKGRYGSGTPLQPERLWRRSFVSLGKLDDMLKRLRRLERLSNID